MLDESAYQALMSITKRPASVMVYGSGSWLTDHEGKRYLDFIQGWAVNCLGHSPRVVVEALSNQASRLISPSPAFYNDQALRLANQLVVHSCFQRVFFASSGAEANEGAIKLARKWGALHRNGAYQIVTMENGFHGRTLATMSASGKPHWEKLFEPKVPGFIKVPLNDLDAVVGSIGPETAAVMLEPVQGEAGVIPASREYLQALRRLTRDKGILLICDEVQTGMGRTGTLFAYQQAGIEPDIMTLGKGIGAGVPLAALLAKEEVCCFEPGDQGGTYNGNPLMAAVGCAVLEELLRPGFLERVRELGETLRYGLLQLSRKHRLGEVRGAGLLLALVLPQPKAEAIAELARERGLIVNAARPEVLRFMPALNVTIDEIAVCLGILDQILGEVFETA
ncbi:acetylornithine aminotransferase [Geomonas silvestris]|uniref:Acetylornithine aminotransferase n=1 Tax=Geomonas silvestris TaxID=2740184 RepID=A0A6V8MMS4_9BACT|nr:acetylornithine transaminase [Geomonas silvestris]GFO61331.1 acetylornithine aminotransferase [Geomonas silvestris]